MFRLMSERGEITGRCNNISWQSDVEALGAQITFDSLYDIPEGAIVSTVFDGREDIRAIIFDKTANRHTYSYTALDFAHLLKNEVIKQFNYMPASEAITSLLSEYGVKCKCTSIPTLITKLYKESLSNIVEDILEQAAADQGVEYVKEMQADSLVIEKLTDRKVRPELLIGADMPIESSISELINRVVVVSGGEGNAAVQAVAENAASIARYGLRQTLYSVDDKDIAQAGNIAKNLLAQGCLVKHRATVPALALSGGQTVKANRLIFLRAGKLNGWYRIKSASHSLAEGKHTISMEVEW